MPAYVGQIPRAMAPRRIPGTGGVNPPGYGDTGGTGFDASLGDGLGVCLVLVFICFLTKIIPNFIINFKKKSPYLIKKCLSGHQALYV